MVMQKNTLGKERKLVKGATQIAIWEVYSAKAFCVAG